MEGWGKLREGTLDNDRLKYLTNSYQLGIYFSKGLCNVSRQLGILTTMEILMGWFYNWNNLSSIMNPFITTKFLGHPPGKYFPCSRLVVRESFNSRWNHANYIPVSCEVVQQINLVRLPMTVRQLRDDPGSMIWLSRVVPRIYLQSI